MSFLIAAPQSIADAATDLVNVGSTIGSAHAAAAAATTGVLPAAADEVSQQIAALFSTHAASYQRLSAQAAAFHEQFVQILGAGAGTYAATEAHTVQTLANAAPVSGLELSGELEASLSADIAGWGASLNAALAGGFGGSLSGLAPLGAALKADLGGGLWAWAQTGGALSSGVGAGCSGLADSLGAGLPGVQSSLGCGLWGLSAELNVALSGSLGGGLSGLGVAVSGLWHTGGSLAASLGAGLGLGISLSGSLTAALGGLCGISPGLGVNMIAGLWGLGGQLNAALSGGLSAGLVGIPTLLANGAAPFPALLMAGSPAAFLAQLQAMQLGFNTALINGEYSFNTALVAQEAAVEAAIFGPGPALNGVVNDVFNFWNTVLGTGEVTIDTVVGAQIPACLWSSFGTGLYLPPLGHAVGVGRIDGLLGALDQKLLFDLDVAGLATGSSSANGSLLAPLGGLPIGSWLPSPVAGLQGWVPPQVHFIHDLVAAETGFNKSLLCSEMTWEASTCGPNAFGGALDRVFNVGNLTLATGEQTVNSLLGAEQAPGLFLAGGCGQVFNGGNIGGLEGILDQSLAAGADLAGLL